MSEQRKDAPPGVTDEQAEVHRGATDEPREAPEQETSDETAPETSERPSEGSAGRGLATLAILLAIGSAAASGYLWWNATRRASEPDQPRIDWSQRIASARSELTGRIESEVGTLAGKVEDLENLQNDLEGLSGDFRELQNELNSAAARADSAQGATRRVEETLRQELESLRRRVEVTEQSVGRLAGERRDEDDRLLVAEAEFLMRLAAARLTLFEDPQGSVTALRLAESNLAAVDDPLYGSVRQTLAKEIQRLQEVEMPDRTELSGALGAVAESVDQWPLRQRRSPQPGSANLVQPDEGETDWLARFRSALADVIYVHRDQPDAAELLTIEQEHLLRENVRLQLGVAQLAALRGDQAPYRDALARVQEWISRYFQTDGPVVSEALDRINNLAEASVRPEVPSLGQALRELRSLRASAELAEEGP